MSAAANTAFTAWLRATRKETRMSQREVAEALKAAGFPVFRQTTVAKIERGDRPVLLDEAVAIAGFFGTTLDVALGLKTDTQAVESRTRLATRTSLLMQIRESIDSELGGAA